MAISDFLDNPIETMVEPFTDVFESLIGEGSGNVFWLIPVIVLTFGIYVKTNNATVTSIFMMGSGVLLGSANIFLGASVMAAVFYIFSGLGFVGLILDLYFQR